MAFLRVDEEQHCRDDGGKATADLATDICVDGSVLRHAGTQGRVGAINVHSATTVQ